MDTSIYSFKYDTVSPIDKNFSSDASSAPIEIKGRIHSFESFGTKDGPGIRFVLFLQGCPLRCLYCHNPDTWKPNEQKYLLSAEEVFKEIEKVKAFIRRGGVTVSGGEPLMQAEFVAELFRLCKQADLHTALDTSGFYLNDKVKKVLEYTDLVLLDVKHIQPDKYRTLTSQALEPTLKFIDYLQEVSKPTWVRYVLVPGYSDDEDDLRKWAEFISQYSIVHRVDILPFHQMGIHKWEEIGEKYKLKEVQPPSKEITEKAETIFRSFNLPIV